MQPPTHTTLELRQEQLEIAKREVDTGRVRIGKRVSVHEEMVDLPLLQETVEVTRVTVNRKLDAPVGTRVEGDVTIVPVLEEVLVTTKQLMLREELHIRRRRSQVHDPQPVTLRREELEVSRLGAADTAEAQPGTTP